MMRLMGSCRRWTRTRQRDRAGWDAYVMRNQFGAFDGARDEAGEYRELAASVSLCSARSGRCKKSGIHLDHKLAQLFEVHNGKVTRIVAWNDRDRALSDLGLTADTGHRTPERSAPPTRVVTARSLIYCDDAPHPTGGGELCRSI